MRVFKDIGLVEQLGSGMSRILKFYDKSVFNITPNFLVVTFIFEDSVSDTISDTVSQKQMIVFNLLKSNEK